MSVILFEDQKYAELARALEPAARTRWSGAAVSNLLGIMERVRQANRRAYAATYADERGIMDEQPPDLADIPVSPAGHGYRDLFGEVANLRYNCVANNGGWFGMDEDFYNLAVLAHERDVSDLTNQHRVEINAAIYKERKEAEDHAAGRRHSYDRLSYDEQIKLFRKVLRAAHPGLNIGRGRGTAYGWLHISGTDKPGADEAMRDLGLEYRQGGCIKDSISPDEQRYWFNRLVNGDQD
jgi:hypothetical protein